MTGKITVRGATPAGSDPAVGYDSSTNLIHVLTAMGYRSYDPNDSFAIIDIGVSGAGYAKPDGMIYDPIDSVFRFSNGSNDYFSMTVAGLVTDTGQKVDPRWSSLAFDQVTTNPALTPTPTPTGTPTATASPTPTPTPTPPPTVGFSQTSSSLDETAGGGEILVELNAPGTQPVRVDYQITGGTATLGLDYVVTTGTLSFTPGVLTQPIPIAIVNDVVVEGDETVTLGLSMPVNATIDVLRGAHVLTIVDNAGEPSGLRIDKWTLRPNASKPEKGKIQLKGEFNNEEALVDLKNGGGVAFDYAGATLVDTLAPSGFTLKRGSKYAYKDATRKGVFLHRIGGSSRSRFSFISKRDVAALAGVSPMDISMTSDGFWGGVSLVPAITAKGSNFNIAKNAYRDHELYIDSLLVKRNPSGPHKDSIRLTLRFPCSSEFLPEIDTLILSLGFFELPVAPSNWTRNRAGTKFVHTSQIGVSKVTIKVDQARRTLSLTGKKLNLPGPDGAMPEASIGLGFADFVKVNAVNLQVKVTRSGTEIFRY